MVLTVGAGKLICTHTIGHLLVDHCCTETGCVLLNGRAPGDEQGECMRA